MVKNLLKLPNGETISYLLERRQRRTIGLKITADGLVVHAPKRIFDYQLNQVLQEKSHWILSKLKAREANYIEPVQWLNDEHLLYLGNDVQLHITQYSTSKAAAFEQNKLLIAQQDPDNQTLTCRKAVSYTHLDVYKRQRTSRVQQTAFSIARLINNNETFLSKVYLAAALAKTDLLTDMVGEFPELQGIMGRYYAQHLSLIHIYLW